LSIPRTAKRILCAGIVVIDYIFRVEAMPKSDTKTRQRIHNFERRQHGQCRGSRSRDSAEAPACRRRSAARPAPTSPATPSCGISSAKTSTIPRSSGSRGVDSSTSAILIEPGRGNAPSSIIATRPWPKGVAKTPAELVADASAVLIDNRFPEFSLPIAQAAKKSGKIVVRDADDPTRHTDALLNACTHVVFSSHGLRTTAQMQDFEQALPALAKRTPALLCRHGWRQWPVVA
jgi:sulfofructose kinase